MPNPPRVLIANDDVNDLLVLRRLLRDTPYAVDTVRSASQAVVAFGKNEYAAVVTDDERLPDMPAATLLGEAERIQPNALRILLAKGERVPALVDAAQEAHYQLIVRPFFAKPLMASLIEQASRWMNPDPKKRENTQKTVSPYINEKPDPSQPAPVEAEAERAPAPGRMARRRALLTMVELVEAKSDHASGHGARVAALAAILGRELGVSAEELEAIEDAALLHDVGELTLDPALLQQKRPLDENEQLEVRRHVDASWQIARRAGLDNLALDGIKYHHERWDGTGHPQGLAGDAIPLVARIVAAADIWDALATDRPYRRAVPLAECVQTFAALAGAQLDPRLVSIYLEKKLYELIDWTDPPRPGVKLV